LTPGSQSLHRSIGSEKFSNKTDRAPESLWILVSRQFVL
jgi:hypothetical protein